ncbi:MAG: peptide ABC transporter substrate-binding protein [Pseudomonadota bacterium]
MLEPFRIASLGTCWTLLLLAACSQSGSDKVDANVLIRASKSEPASLNPQLVYDTGSAEIARDLFEGLLRWDQSGNLIPAAAESYQISEDGKRLLFSIRNNARWSNGDRLTAEDFVRGLQFALSPENKSPQAALLRPIKNAGSVLDLKAPAENIGVVAISDSQLAIDLEAPAPYFVTLLDYPLTYPRHASTSDAAPITNGAYSLVSHRPGYRTDLAKNRYYWDNANVQISEVQYLHLDAEVTEVNLFRSGELHISSTVPSSMAPLLLKDHPEEYHTTPQLGTYYYAFNLTEGPLSDETIRVALIEAVDTTELTAELLFSGQAPASTLIPPYLWDSGFGNDPRTSQTKKIDALEQARAKLEEQGYTERTPLPIRLAINSGDNHRKIALYVANAWNELLPVEVEIQSYEFKVLLDIQKDKSAWDVVRTSWTADFPDAVNFLEIFVGSSPNNIPGYNDDYYNRLVAESYDTSDSLERAKVLYAAEQRLVTSNSNLFLYHYVDRRLASSQLGAFVGNKLGIYRSQDLYFKSSQSSREDLSK